MKMNRKTFAREGLLVVGLVGGWFVLLPVLAFFFYSPHEGGPIHLAGLLLRDLFVDLRPGVWLLVFAPLHPFSTRPGCAASSWQTARPQAERRT